MKKVFLLVLCLISLILTTFAQEPANPSLGSANSGATIVQGKMYVKKLFYLPVYADLISAGTPTQPGTLIMVTNGGINLPYVWNGTEWVRWLTISDISSNSYVDSIYIRNDSAFYSRNGVEYFYFYTRQNLYVESPLHARNDSTWYMTPASLIDSGYFTPGMYDTTLRAINHIYFTSDGLFNDSLHIVNGYGLDSIPYIIRVPVADGWIIVPPVNYSGIPYNYDIGVGLFRKGGIYYDVHSARITIDSSEADPRTDLIGADTTGFPIYKKGEAGSPTHAAPTFDPSFQIGITELEVPAGVGVTPVLDTAFVYKNNAEGWEITTFTGLTVDSANTVPGTVYEGTKSISVSGTHNSSSYKVVHTGGVFDMSPYTSMNLYIKLKQALTGNNSIQMRLINGTTVVSSMVTLQLNKGNITSFQPVNIPLTQFAVTTNIITGFQIYSNGTTVSPYAGYYLDYWYFQKGIPVLPPVIPVTSIASYNAAQDTIIFTTADGFKHLVPYKPKVDSSLFVTVTRLTDTAAAIRASVSKRFGVSGEDATPAQNRTVDFGSTYTLNLNHITSYQVIVDSSSSSTANGIFFANKFNNALFVQTQSKTTGPHVGLQTSWNTGNPYVQLHASSTNVASTESYIRMYRDSTIMFLNNSAKYFIYNLPTTSDSATYKPFGIDPSTHEVKQFTSWPGGGGGDLQAVTNIGRTTTNEIIAYGNGLGTTQDTTKGILLENTTPAASGAQQISPEIRWKGSGFTSSAVPMEWRMYSSPSSGTLGSLKIQNQVNNGGWGDVATLNNGGSAKLAVTGGITASTSIAVSGAFYAGSGFSHLNDWYAGATNAITDVFIEHVGTVGGVPAGDSKANNYFSTGTFGKASSGTHNLFANLLIQPPQISSGLSTLNYAATVYIRGSAFGTGVPTNNYALWVDSGIVRLDDPNIIVNDGTDTVATKAYARSVGGGGGSSTLAGLTDVSLTGLAANDFLKNNGTNWVNRTPAQVLSDIGAIGGTATNTQVSFGSGTNTISSSANFVWDNSNGYLGIGTSITPASKLHILTTSIGTTLTDAHGILLENTTAATSGNQQQSPGIVLAGKGWKTTATAASEDVRFRISTLPIQGSADPNMQLKIEQSVNGGAYVQIFTVGANTVGNAGTATFSLGTDISSAWGMARNGSNLLIEEGGTNNFGFTGTSFKGISTATFGWVSSTNSTATADLLLARRAAGAMSQINGANAQEFRIYNTGTGTNDEYAAIGFQANSNVFTIGTGITGSGTLRSISLANKVGINGVTAPTASLHLPAGTATANTAPLKLTSGTNLTTPEDGAIEYNGSHFFGTNSTTRIQLDNENYFVAAATLLGSTIKYLPLGLTWSQANSTQALADGQARVEMIYIDKPTLLTGVKFFQRTQGSYTADNNNYIALYSTDGSTTVTQVAITANDGTLWKGTANTMISVPFTATYTAQPGVYYVVALYNNSAQVTAPTIAAANNLDGTSMTTYDFTNGHKISSFYSGTSLPSTITTSSFSTDNSRYFLMPY